MFASNRRRWAPAALAVVAVAFSAGALVATILGGGGTGGTTTTVVAGTPVARAVSMLTVNQIYNRVSSGVVTLEVTATVTDRWGRTRTAESEGTGFLVTASGDIVTNAHVVEGATAISVTFKSGAIASARLVGTDPSTDLAVVRVSSTGTKLVPLAFGDSSKLKVGDGVVAIGSPFGLAQSVTTGIVSALHRTIEAPDGSRIENAIQTDAAINSGNSGGPLFDATGTVVGVTSQIASASGGNDGVGFAVASATAKGVVAAIVAGGV